MGNRIKDYSGSDSLPGLWIEDCFERRQEAGDFEVGRDPDFAARGEGEKSSLVSNMDGGFANWYEERGIVCT